MVANHSTFHSTLHSTLHSTFQSAIPSTISSSIEGPWLAIDASHPMRWRGRLWLLITMVCLLSATTTVGQTTLGVTAAPPSAQAAVDNPPQISLQAAVAQSLANDPWLNASQYRQEALLAESVSSESLPDPRISLNAANFPVDTFDIHQEAMTQLGVGISQRFPRGESLALQGRQKRDLAGEEPLLRADRMARVTSTVSRLWLEAYRAKESIDLIARERGLFEPLVDVATRGYAAAVGRSNQQDVIRAQLELTRIDDRLTVLRQQHDANVSELSEWLGPMGTIALSSTLPNLEPTLPQSIAELNRSADPQFQFEHIASHPALRAIEQRISAMETGVDLVKQQYQPEWGLTAQYGYRDDDPLGRDRADLFSIGVSFDIPLFTAKRQDQNLSAAQSRAAAARTEKQLVARRMVAELTTTLKTLERLNERDVLYRERLLPQMVDQADASLNAYNNDQGDFAEAVRARIAELNGRIEALNIAVDRQQQFARLHYLLASGELTRDGVSQAIDHFSSSAKNPSSTHLEIETKTVAATTSGTDIKPHIENRVKTTAQGAAS